MPAHESATLANDNSPTGKLKSSAVYDPMINCTRRSHEKAKERFYAELASQGWPAWPEWSVIYMAVGGIGLMGYIALGGKI